MRRILLWLATLVAQPAERGSLLRRSYAPAGAFPHTGTAHWPIALCSDAVRNPRTVLQEPRYGTMPWKRAQRPSIAVGTVTRHAAPAGMSSRRRNSGRSLRCTALTVKFCNCWPYRRKTW
jgi:hypothetical protein